LIYSLLVGLVCGTLVIEQTSNLGVGSVWWHMPVVPSIWEDKAGELLELQVNLGTIAKSSLKIKDKI
jgi:hypothetical protein